ncbi:MAG: DUF4174 domain-containing protein [Spirosomataceae bacterium]
MQLFILIAFRLFGLFQEPLENKLESFVGKRRVVVVYCPKVSDSEFKLQKKWLSEVGKDMLERDLTIIDCVETGLAETDALHLKERFHYNPDRFCIWLIGKDGEIKHISGKPVKPELLFGLIDAMPLRRRETGKN